MIKREKPVIAPNRLNANPSYPLVKLEYAIPAAKPVKVSQFGILKYRMSAIDAMAKMKTRKNMTGSMFSILSLLFQFVFSIGDVAQIPLRNIPLGKSSFEGFPYSY